MHFLSYQTQPNNTPIWKSQPKQNTDMVQSRSVQQNRDPTHTPNPIRSGQTTGQPDTSEGQRQISASRTRKWRVSWWVFSPKPEDTRPNRELSISWWSFLDPREISAISNEFSARSMESSPNLARSQPNLMRFRQIQRKSDENITQIPPISPLKFRILVNFQISNSDRTNHPPLNV